jgi:hypothetical protein
MAHFSVYNTSVPGANGGEPPFPPIKSEGTFSLQPIQMDFAEYVSGSVQSEQAGTLFIEQAFDYPQNHENEEDSIAKAHWVPVETSKEGEKLDAGIAIVGKKPVTFLVFAGAPYLRLRWEDTSKTENKELRIFARAQEKGRI